MQAYKDKLHAALREIAECPVSMRTVEQAAAVTDLLCRLDKLEDHDEPEAATFDRETAMQWAANMQNADGTAGPHWTMEQTTAVAESMGIQAPAVPRWAWGVTMNMMYSDYCMVASKYGVNNAEFFADMARAFLFDKDAEGPGEKLAAYYHSVVKG